MGHLLPHPYNQVVGHFREWVEIAVTRYISRLYKQAAPSTAPLSNKTPPKPERNAEIQALYAQGWSVPELAKKFGISKPRVYQILKNLEK